MVDFFHHLQSKLSRLLDLSMQKRIGGFQRMTSKRNADRVTSLFERIVSISAPSTEQAAWLEGLKKRAMGQITGWRSELAAFLQGLPAEVIPATELSAIEREALDCGEGSPTYTELFLPLVWTLFVSLSVLAWESKTASTRSLVIGSFVAALIGAVWANSARWLPYYQSMSKKRRLIRRAAVGMFSMFAISVGVFLPALTGELTKIAALKSFEREHDQYSKDPDGFPWIRNLAKSAYGVDVVLGSATDTWAMTSLELAGASAASISEGHKVCVLAISPASIFVDFGPPTRSEALAWQKGVTMHEFGHCLDVRRDFTGAEGAWSGSSSIAPDDRPPVHDAASYFENEVHRPSTMVWREALADIMAVGYWRLTSPAPEATVMISNLRAKRYKAQDTDKGHATMCWIDKAATSPLPVNVQLLFNWADKIRSNAICEVPKNRGNTD